MFTSSIITVSPLYIKVGYQTSVGLKELFPHYRFALRSPTNVFPNSMVSSLHQPRSPSTVVSSLHPTPSNPHPQLHNPSTTGRGESSHWSFLAASLTLSPSRDGVLREENKREKDLLFYCFNYVHCVSAFGYMCVNADAHRYLTC